MLILVTLSENLLEDRDVVLLSMLAKLLQIALLHSLVSKSELLDVPKATLLLKNRAVNSFEAMSVNHCGATICFQLGKWKRDVAVAGHDLLG